VERRVEAPPEKLERSVRDAKLKTEIGIASKQAGEERPEKVASGCGDRETEKSSRR